MHNNYWKCNHETKEELSMDIDARPCNIASKGNNIFPRSRGVWRPRRLEYSWESCDELTNLHRCALARILILHPELRKAIIFKPKIAPKRFFYGKNIFYAKIHFSYPSSPLSGSRSWQWPKVSLETIKWTIKKH